MISFPNAVRRVYSQYAVFTGTATRAEYWWFYLFTVIVNLVLRAIPVLDVIFVLATFLPGLAVGVRRMHDSGHSGWWIICPLVDLVFLFFPTKEIGNKYATGTIVSAANSIIDEANVSQTSQTCPQCGKLRLPGQNFCQACGHAF